MTRWCTRDGVPVRLARLSTPVEHHRQRCDSHREDGSGRNSRRPEHISILLHCGVGLSSGGRRREASDSRSNPRPLAGLGPREDQLVAAAGQARIATRPTAGDRRHGDRFRSRTVARNAPNPGFRSLIGELNPGDRRGSIGEPLNIDASHRADLVDADRRAKGFTGGRSRPVRSRGRRRCARVRRAWCWRSHGPHLAGAWGQRLVRD